MESGKVREWVSKEGQGMPIGTRVRNKHGKVGRVEDVYGYPGGWVVRWEDGSISLKDFFHHDLFVVDSKEEKELPSV